MSEARQIPVEWHVIAERVANVVNKNIQPILRRLDSLEAKVRRLEMDIELLRERSIEAALRAALSVKMEGLPIAVAARVSEKLAQDMAKIEELLTDVHGVVEALNKVKERQEALMSRVDRIEARINKIEETVKAQRSLPVDVIVAQVSRSVEQRIVEIEEKMRNVVSEATRKMEELSKVAGVKALETVAAKLGELEKQFNELKEMVLTLKELLEEAVEEEASEGG